MTERVFSDDMEWTLARLPPKLVDEIRATIASFHPGKFYKIRLNSIADKPAISRYFATEQLAFVCDTTLVRCVLSRRILGFYTEGIEISIRMLLLLGEKKVVIQPIFWKYSDGDATPEVVRDYSLQELVEEPS